MPLEIKLISDLHGVPGKERITVEFRDIENGKKVTINYFLKGNDTIVNVIRKVWVHPELVEGTMNFLKNGRILNYKGLDIMVGAGEDEEWAFQNQKWKLNTKKNFYDNATKSQEYPNDDPCDACGEKPCHCSHPSWLE